MAIDPYIGEIKPWPMNFAPRGWALCEGQLIPIHQNVALFSLLGAQYGGDGRTTFALPDMRGRFPMGVGSNDWPGDTGGANTVTPQPTPVAPGSGAQAAEAGSFDNRPPFVAMNYIIALQGVFPPRS